MNNDFATWWLAGSISNTLLHGRLALVCGGVRAWGRTPGVYEIIVDKYSVWTHGSECGAWMSEGHV
jgi:hypothetical protein